MPADIIQPYLDKKCTLDLGSMQESIFFIDWARYEDEHRGFMTQVEGMSVEEMDEFYNANISTYILIMEYFMDEDCAHKVQDRDWVPFAILGLPPDPETFADGANSGILLLDETTGTGKDPAVIWFREGESRVLAEKFSKLKIITE